MSVDLINLLTGNQPKPSPTPTPAPTPPPDSPCLDKSPEIVKHVNWDEWSWSSDPNYKLYPSFFSLDTIPFIKRTDTFKAKIPLKNSIIIGKRDAVGTTKAQFFFFIAREGDLSTITNDDIFYTGNGGLYQFLKNIDGGINDVTILLEDKNDTMSMTQCNLWLNERTIYHNLGRTPELMIMVYKEDATKKYRTFYRASNSFFADKSELVTSEKSDVHIKIAKTSYAYPKNLEQTVIMFAENKPVTWFPVPNIKYAGVSYPMAANNDIGIEKMFLPFFNLTNNTIETNVASYGFVNDDCFFYSNGDAYYGSKSYCIREGRPSYSEYPDNKVNINPIQAMYMPKVASTQTAITVPKEIHLPFDPDGMFYFYHGAIKLGFFGCVPVSHSSQKNTFGYRNYVNLPVLASSKLTSATYFYFKNIKHKIKIIHYTASGTSKRVLQHNFGVMPDFIFYGSGTGYMNMPALGAKAGFTHNTAAKADTYITGLTENTCLLLGSAALNMPAFSSFNMIMLKNTPELFYCGYYDAVAGMTPVVDTFIKDIGIFMIKNVTTNGVMYYYDFSGTEAGMPPVCRKLGVTTSVPVNDITIQDTSVTINATYHNTAKNRYIWIAFSKFGGRTMSASNSNLYIDTCIEAPIE